MSEITQCYDMLSSDPDKEISANTQKILSLIESELYLKSIENLTSSVYQLAEIIYSARADIRYKLQLLNGMIAEFKDDEQWKYRGSTVMNTYEEFRKGIELMESADELHFTLMNFSRDEQGEIHTNSDYPKFSSVDEISRYIDDLFDNNTDSEDDPEWYIAKRHDENAEQTAVYLLSKCGTVWKYGVEDDSGEYQIAGEEIFSSDVGLYGEILTADSRPFKEIFHILCYYDGEEMGLYVDNGMLRILGIECSWVDFEDFALGLRVELFDGADYEISENEKILLELRNKYRSLGDDEGNELLEKIAERIWKYSAEMNSGGMPIELIREEFLR